MGLMKPTRSAFKTVLSICIASREAEIGDNLVAKAVKVQYSRAFGLLITQLTYQLSAHPSRPTSKQRGREGQWKAKHMFSFRCISCCPLAFCSSMPPMSLPCHCLLIAILPHSTIPCHCSSVCLSFQPALLWGMDTAAYWLPAAAYLTGMDC